MQNDRVYFMPKIAHADFAGFQELLKRDSDFPSSFLEWASFIAVRRREEEHRQQEVVLVDVRLVGFKAYCAEYNFPLTVTALGKYAEYLGHSDRM